MKRIFIFTACVLMAGAVSAQSKRSLVAIDNELKQSKSTATAEALIEQIGETTPQTDEDVAILGQLMDKYPTQGQKSLSGIKDPKLVKAVMKECERQAKKVKADKDIDWKTLPEEQRQEKIVSLLNVHATIATLGNLKNKDALPLLKQYITPEYDGVLSYEASQAVGKIAPNDPAVFKEMWGKNDVKNISYNAYGPSVLKEVAQKMQDPNVSESEKRKILSKGHIWGLGGRSKDEKELIKDIVLNHPNKEFREEASVAMVHAVMNNHEESDKDFVMQWAKKEKSLAQNDVIHVMDILWDNKFVPDVVNIMKTGSYPSARMAAASSLGRHQVKESLQYLKSCVEIDKDGNVRGECRHSYYVITGSIPVVFHLDDVVYFEKQFKEQRHIDFYSKLKNNDPLKKEHLALKNSLEEFKVRGNK